VRSVNEPMSEGYILPNECKRSDSERVRSVKRRGAYGWENGVKHERNDEGQADELTRRSER